MNFSRTRWTTRVKNWLPVFAWAGFIDGEGAAIEFLAIELRDGGGGFFLCSHGDEGEAAGLAREFVHDQFATADVAGLFEQVENVAFGGVERQVTDE